MLACQSLNLRKLIKVCGGFQSGNFKHWGHHPPKFNNLNAPNDIGGEKRLERKVERLPLTVAAYAPAVTEQHTGLFHGGILSLGDLG
jgi:hypothetical protein